MSGINIEDIQSLGKWLCHDDDCDFTGDTETILSSEGVSMSATIKQKTLCTCGLHEVWHKIMSEVMEVYMESMTGNKE